MPTRAPVDPVTGFFESQGRSEPPWPRLFNRLKERREQIAELILGGALDEPEYKHQTGRHTAIAEIIDEMQAMMRGEDLPRKTELPEV